MVDFIEDIDRVSCIPLQTKEGDIYDCVDIYKQLAFDNPLLKNHTIPVYFCSFFFFSEIYILVRDHVI